jgi:hypothetical protein
MTGIDMDGAAALRAVWRAEEAEWSRVALERWEHGRTLADVARDCMARDEAVTVAFATATWSGAVAAVGVDVVRLAVGPGLVDVRLSPDAPFVLRIRPSPPPPHDGRGAREGVVTTFTARLRELDGILVCIGTAGASLEGRLRVGRDQLRLADRDDACAYVPIGSVWWVRPLDDD